MMTANDLDRPVSPFDRVIRSFRAPEWGQVAAILAILVLIRFLNKDRAFFQSHTIPTLIDSVAWFGALAIGAANHATLGARAISSGGASAARTRATNEPDGHAPRGHGRQGKSGRRQRRA